MAGNLTGTSRANPTVSDIRTIFPNNLRKLCERAGSVTGIANELGINRAQFVRYMNGESSPRPEILEKICRYFGLDARILLEEL